ncbi:hypothetical protein [Thiohalorhabdus sp.]|uniref:hypothetical protein n=1 Tax=Thiohalorhabdus sp. TaxID=3094134 RepID=UPI002FC32E94
MSIGLSDRNLQFSEPDAGPRFRIRFNTDYESWRYFQTTKTTGMRVRGQGAFQGGTFLFELEAWNPNPTAGRNKDGEVYRITLEVTRETWLWFLDHTRREDIFGVRLWREEDVPAPETERPYAGVAKRLHQAGFFRSQAVAQALGSEERFAEWVRTHPCAVCGRYDYDRDTGRQATQYAHVTRVSAGSGKSVKPPYHGFPLCDYHHRNQHNNGWIALYQAAEEEKGHTPTAISREEARDWADRKAARYRSAWAHERFRAECGVESLAQAPPEAIRGTAAILGIGWALPDLEPMEEEA